MVRESSVTTSRLKSRKDRVSSVGLFRVTSSMCVRSPSGAQRQLLSRCVRCEISCRVNCSAISYGAYSTGTPQNTFGGFLYGELYKYLQYEDCARWEIHSAVILVSSQVDFK